MAEQTDIPRPEHPRPQFVRDDWTNLNGTWTFALDPGRSGRDRGLAESTGFGRTIRVPFCPESELSGVGHTDFIEAMWYHRQVEVPGEWAGRRVLLHFGGVDYACEVYVDGLLAGTHFGGSASFAIDVTALVRPGQAQHLVVHVRDELRGGTQPRGKQSPRFDSHGCLYTRTTGIWQTVWLEAAAATGLRDCHILPDLDAGRFVLVPAFHAAPAGMTFRATLLADGEEIARVEGPAADGAGCVLTPPRPRPWSPSDPFLYGLRLQLLDADGRLADSVLSYAGLRKVHVDGDRVMLNNQPLHQRLVLDQGFYPDGIWTAPSDAALKRDIELSMAAGFNGARLHQKVFEERFHYWADRLGYLTWGESASWGMGISRTDGPASAAGQAGWNFLNEWREIVVRDRNHPSIIAWTPFNETRNPNDVELHHRLQAETVGLTRSLDPTRPINDASGYVHVTTDLWTVHAYQQDPAKLREQMTPDADGLPFRNFPDDEPDYAGQPYLVDEFGGIKWIPVDRRPHSETSWGYGNAPRTLEEFYKRLAGLVAALDDLPHIRGWCYTQLTDVEQEQNGIYTYDRAEKFDMDRVRSILSGKGDPGPGERE